MKKPVMLIVLLMIAVSVSAQSYKIQYKMDDILGTMQKIRVQDDPAKMNWIIPADGSKYPWLADKKYAWGEFRNTIPQGEKKITLKTSCRRYFLAGGYNLVEEYTIENDSEVEVDLSQVEISTPWNAKYLSIDTMSAQIRCRIQVFTKYDGSTATCVKATRLNGQGPHVGLMVTEGDISDWYTGDCNDISDDSTCGSMYVKLEKKKLAPGKKYTISWQIFAYKDDKDFLKRIRIKFGKNTVLKGL